ncbi:glutamic acid-rich protein-like [Vigna radiata var. radiata]|uniref:Glutamic acid-rich protein-like n=1 Tax=Vigna radiata var. radiata TaxID=3916 RepID=A0A1S3VVB4_VIGRR|nr:glutamic acid-rich protein-like [Vigna radiata var. radiata]
MVNVFPEELQQDVNCMGAQFSYKQGAFNQGSFSQDECKAILTSHKRKADWEPIDFENNEKGYEEMMDVNDVNKKGSSEDEIELADEEEDPEEDIVEPEKEERIELTDEEEDPEEDVIEPEKKEGVELTKEEEEFVDRPQKTKHPPKVEDPGCLTISCVLNECDVGEAMIDSGASINMLPKHFLTKFRGLVLKPSNVIVTIADGSMAKSIGMVEDVIVRVEKLEFLVDFIVMDVDNDEEIPEEVRMIRRVGHKKPEREAASEDRTSEECKVVVTKSKRKAEEEAIEIESNEEEDEEMSENVESESSEGDEEEERLEKNVESEERESHYEPFREIFNEVTVVPLT